jgi:tetratricopeptide (TPR) repeat protein
MRQVGENKGAQAVLSGLAGDLLQAQGNTIEAEKAYEHALGLDPDYMDPYVALARMHLRNGNAAKAIAQYQAALEQNPQQPGIQTVLGTLFDQQQQPEQAEAHYRKALAIDPEFAPAANNLAYLLANSDRSLDEALDFARLAKSKYPDDPGVMDTLGLVYLKKGLIDSAISELKESAAKLENNPTVRYHLGLAYHLQGNADLARQELRAALDSRQTFPEKKDAQQLLGEL